MSLLETYEQQYASLIAEITIKIGKLTKTTGTEHRDLSANIDSSLAEAQELLEQMNLEVRDLHYSQRASFTSKLDCAYVELQRLNKEYSSNKNAKRRSSCTDLDTIVYCEDEDVAISNDQHQRLLDNSERIERTGHKLTDGYRVVLETETLGAQVLNDLHHQRETIQSARERLRDTNANLGRASRTLNSMIYRAMREKIVLYVLGICFVLAVVLSLYLSFSATPNA